MGLVKSLRAELAEKTERLAECSYRVIQLEGENANLRGQLTAAREALTNVQTFVPVADGCIMSCGECDSKPECLWWTTCGLTAAMKGAEG